MEWITVNPPAHRPTPLRLDCRRERGRTGRHHVQAFHDQRWVYGAFYSWDIWEGHCGGLLLMETFLDRAEHAAAALER